MGFYDILNKYNWSDIKRQIEASTAGDVERALVNSQLTLEDFLYLISPAADPYMEKMAQQAHRLTEQRFGKVMNLFAPLYLSNQCTNSCKYCGFNIHNTVNRVTLNPDQAKDEGAFLHDQGFRHILLVSGEVPEIVTLPYLVDVVEKLRPLFASISIELYPMTVSAYQSLISAGTDGLVIFQETYDRDRYDTVHPAGKKRDFRWRLETPERAGKAGFRRIGIGALLGLSDWRTEGFFLALHARYLLRHFWKSQITISFPRLQPSASGFQAPHPVPDRQLVQLILALRLLFPDVSLVLSTREVPQLRDNLIPLGITSMSAGSKTDPGGYTQACEAEEQFEIADHRSPAIIAEMLAQKGYEPVWKDWDAGFLNE